MTLKETRVWTGMVAHLLQTTLLVGVAAWAFYVGRDVIAAGALIAIAILEAHIPVSGGAATPKAMSDD